MRISDWSSDVCSSDLLVSNHIVYCLAQKPSGRDVMNGAARSRVRLGLIFLLFIISAIAFLDRTNISVAGVEMRKEYAIDQVQLGWVFSAFLIGYALFQVPAGWLAARYGPRIVLTGALLWWGVFTAATALLHPAGRAAVLLPAPHRDRTRGVEGKGGAAR